MPTIRLKNGSYDRTLNCIPSTLRKKTDGSDIERYESDVNGASPNLREGINKTGQCKVVVDDGTANTASLAQLLVLRSPVGEGDFTVYIDGTEHAYHSLVDISMDGAIAQFVTIEWAGTIEE